MNNKMKNAITVIYSDDQHRLTDKENATHVEITEYDDRGKRVRTVYGRWVEGPALFRTTASAGRIEKEGDNGSDKK